MLYNEQSVQQHLYRVRQRDISEGVSFTAALWKHFKTQFRKQFHNRNQNVNADIQLPADRFHLETVQSIQRKGWGALISGYPPRTWLLFKYWTHFHGSISELYSAWKVPRVPLFLNVESNAFISIRSKNTIQFYLGRMRASNSKVNYHLQMGSFQNVKFTRLDSLIPREILISLTLHVFSDLNMNNDFILSQFNILMFPITFRFYSKISTQ